MNRLKEIVLQIFMIIVLVSSIIFPISTWPLPTWTGYLILPAAILLSLIFHKQMDNKPSDTIFKIVSTLWLILWSIGFGVLLAGNTTYPVWFNAGYYIAFGLYILHMLFLFTDVYNFVPTPPDKRKKWMSRKRKEDLGFAIYQAAIQNCRAAQSAFPDIPYATTYALALSTLFGQCEFSKQYSDNIVLDISDIARNYIHSQLRIDIEEYDSCLESIVSLWNNHNFSFEIHLAHSFFKSPDYSNEEYTHLCLLLKRIRENIERQILCK